MNIIPMKGSPSLYLDFRFDGKRHKIAGFPGRESTERYAENVQALIDAHDNIYSPPPAVQAWVSRFPRRRREQLCGLGERIL